MEKFMNAPTQIKWHEKSSQDFFLFQISDFLFYSHNRHYTWMK